MSALDRNKASDKLSSLELNYSYGGLEVEMYWFRVMALEEPWSIGKHTHSAYEFHFVAEGKSFVELEESAFTVETGEFYVTSPGMVHEQRSIQGEEYVEYCMHCQISLNEHANEEEELLIQLLENNSKSKISNSRKCIDYFGEALRCAYEEKVGYYTEIKHLIFLIWIAAVQQMTSSQHNYAISKKHKKDDYRFQMIKQFVEDNIKSPILVKDIAQFMYLSEKQVNRIVLKNSGRSTKNYINHCKLIKAKELLKDTHMQIKEISDFLGFSSPYYFTQFFTREEGFSPRLFRDNIHRS